MSLFRIFAPIVLVSILITDSGRAQTDSWQALSEVKPEAPLLIYLKNGGRMKQRFISYDQSRLVTDIGEIARKDIAAISLFRPERLWDGTLRGGAIGTGALLIPLAAYGDGTDGAAGAAVIGFLAGAGLGALFDAGVAKPDKPVFVDSPQSESASTRRWSLKVPHENLAGWLRHQRVQLMLKDGTYVRGTVVKGTETSLEIDVRESSRQGLHGNASVNTTEIGTVIFRQKLGGSTAAAAAGGAISGFWLGAVAGVGNGDSESGPRIIVGALGGALAGGLLSGFGISHMNTREITLVVE